MSYSFDEQIVSDLHKDARGFRPSVHWWQVWESASSDQKQQIWDSLIVELNDEIVQERAQQQKALEAFDARVQQALDLGAADQAEAVRWIFQAERFDSFDLGYGSSFVCYRFGLSYSNKYVDLFEQVCNKMIKESVDS